MTTRTTSKSVTFQKPFTLSGLDTLQAAGTYTIETVEEELDAASRFAWKRVSTVIQLTALGATENHEIDPGELDEALLRDRAGASRLPVQSTSVAGRARSAQRVLRKKF